MGGTRALEVVVVGAGQAGLAVSHGLSVRGIEHVVLERARIAQAWRDRWDSFTLVTPNWTMCLPGAPYRGPDPDGFAGRGEVVSYLEGYAASAPVREGVAVERLDRSPDGAFRLTTSEGELRAGTVVVCTGAYQRPHHPAGADRWPPGIQMMGTEEYRKPDDVPAGRVLVVGSGQTGAQLAEDLTLAGRDVVLACGRAPWVPRHPGDRDIVAWLEDTSFFDLPLAALPNPAARLVANVQATGRAGGHDLHYRTLQELGVLLVGRVTGVEEAAGVVRFAPDLAESVAFGDARYADIRALCAADLPQRGLTPPPLADPEPFRAPVVEELPLRDFGAVLFTAGFRPRYTDWVDVPVFDGAGFPVTVDGTTEVPGQYFCGVHFMRTRRSALLFGVGEDAELVAESVAARLG